MNIFTNLDLLGNKLEHVLIGSNGISKAGGIRYATTIIDNVSHGVIQYWDPAGNDGAGAWVSVGEGGGGGGITSGYLGFIPGNGTTASSFSYWATVNDVTDDDQTGANRIKISYEKGILNFSKVGALSTNELGTISVNLGIDNSIINYITTNVIAADSFKITENDNGSGSLSVILSHTLKTMDVEVELYKISKDGTSRLKVLPEIEVTDVDTVTLTLSDNTNNHSRLIGNYRVVIIGHKRASQIGWTVRPISRESSDGIPSRYFDE